MNTYNIYERLKTVNKILTIVIVVFAAYLIIDPLIPEVVYQAKRLERALVKPVSAAETTATYDLSYNHLIIPSIFVDKKIIEATNVRDIHESVWRLPNTSIPNRGSNTGLAAHRYANLGTPWHESTFYKLPSLKVGDRATVVWQGKIYTYEVFRNEVMPPTAARVMLGTADPILTLMTCTLNGKDRIIVQLKLVETNDTNASKFIVK